MNKILHVTNAYPNKEDPAFGIFIKEQIDGLKEVGIEADIYFINAKKKGRREYYRAYKQLKQIINNYTIIHCHHFLSAFITLMAKSSAQKIVVSFVSDGIKEFMIPDTLLNKFIKTKMYKFILEKSSARIFKNRIPSEIKLVENNFYIPNGVDTQLFVPIEKKEARKKLSLDVDKKYILFVSSQNLYRPEKQYNLFKDVVNILRKEDTTIEELTMSNITRDQISLFYSAADLHLLTSKFEGSPNSVKESLSCNTPVVSTNVGNVAEMVSNMDGCFVSKSMNPQELANLCLKSLNSRKEKKLRENLFIKGLDKDSSIKSLINVYKAVGFEFSN